MFVELGRESLNSVVSLYAYKLLKAKTTRLPPFWRQRFLQRRGGGNTKNQFYIIFLLFADKIEGDLIEKLYKAQLIPQIYESFENDEEKDHMKKYAVNLRYASNLNFN